MNTPPMTLVTLWFVTAANPKAVMAKDPHPDRGFARKYLAQLNPAWPLTHIGDFDMSRSAAPGLHEFYIGGYPGVAVVRTLLPGVTRLSQLPVRYRELVPAADVYATCEVHGAGGAPATTSTSPTAGTAAASDAVGTAGGHSPVGANRGEVADGGAAAAESLASFGMDDWEAGLGSARSGDLEGLAGFAHWSGGELKRAFSATREIVFEDLGLPCPFELPFWEGTVAAKGIQLPFIPVELAQASVRYWLGFDTGEAGPDIHICAFATDGRPESKNDLLLEDSRRRAGREHDAAVTAADREQLNAAGESYDDYTPAADRPLEDRSGKEIAAAVARSAKRQAVQFTHTIRAGAGRARRFAQEIRRKRRR